MNQNIAQTYTLLLENGKYIGVKKYYNYFINLYLLDDIFYELWYFKDSNVVEKISVLEDDETLDLYISQMLISDKSYKLYHNL